MLWYRGSNRQSSGRGQQDSRQDRTGRDIPAQRWNCRQWTIFGTLPDQSCQVRLEPQCTVNLHSAHVDPALFDWEGKGQIERLVQLGKIGEAVESCKTFGWDGSARYDSFDDVFGVATPFRESTQIYGDSRPWRGCRGGLAAGE